jgi:peroxiredoxin
MSQTEQREADGLFEVEITSGGRAHDADAPREEARAISATRLEAKARAHRRNLTIAIAGAAFLAIIALWAWLSNPNTNVPSDAVARVNGEFILEADITREIELTRASFALSNRDDAEAPSRSAVLEELISRKMQVQDASKAGVEVSPQEVDNELANVLQRTGDSLQELEAALEKHNLKLDDIKLVIANTSMVNKYIAEYVVADASTDAERQNRVNEWRTTLFQTSKVERFKSSGTGPAPRVGSEAPDFTLKDLGGKEVKLSDLRGRPVMLNFWATWCPPCRAEIPVIRELYAETNANGEAYEILGVATQSDAQTIQAFAEELDITFPILPDAENRITELYHVLPIPTSFFIDKDGIIRYMHIGILDRTTLEKWLLD